MKQIIQSLLLTFGISLVISVPFYPENYWKAVSIIVGIQIFGGWVVNTILENIRLAKEAQIYNESLEILSQNIANIPCTGCKNVMSVPIFIAEENIFVCERCSCETKIEVNLNPIMLTKMIDNNIAIDEIFEQVNNISTEKEEK